MNRDRNVLFGSTTGKVPNLYLYPNAYQRESARLSDLKTAEFTYPNEEEERGNPC
jgi:hypothetical protein